MLHYRIVCAPGAVHNKKLSRNTFPSPPHQKLLSQNTKNEFFIAENLFSRFNLDPTPYLPIHNVQIPTLERFPDNHTVVDFNLPLISLILPTQKH